ncbi:radical SAM protein [bacterium]|nr:radical SAM protein [bacterium]
MKKFESCGYIEHGMVLDHCNIIRHCNNFNPRYDGRPIIYENYKGQKIDWKEFFEIKRNLRKLFRENSCPKQCTECVGIAYKEWDDDDYIDYLLLTPWVPCNSKCIYCEAPRNEHVLKNTKIYKILPLIKDMIRNKILIKEATIDFAGGEPTIYSEFESLLNEFIRNDYKKIIVHTNAIKKSRSVIKGLKKGCVRVLVSIDAGSKEMHKKIKQVNSYDSVWNNLKEYAKNQPKDADFVKAKYIIVPEVNDSEQEINIWLNRCKEINIKSVVLNLDFNWIMKNVDGNLLPIYNLMKYTQKRAKELGINCELYGQIFQVKCEIEQSREENIAGF